MEPSFLICHGIRSYLAGCEKLERQREATASYGEMSLRGHPSYRIKMLPCLGQSADLEPMLAISSSIYKIYKLRQISSFKLEDMAMNHS